MPQIDELFIKIDDNIDDILKRLKKLEKEGRETGDRVESDFTKAFNAIKNLGFATAIVSGFKQIITAANETEKALRGVAAVAKQTGQDVQESQKATLELSKDGQISLRQSANIIRQLLKLGLDADKALEFATASKSIGTFNGLLDTTGESVESFTKGLITGSAELLENLDPALRKTIVDLGGYAKVAQDATARQKLVNEVIKQGGELQGEYASFLEGSAAQTAKFETNIQRLSVALGNTANSAIAPLLSILNEFLEALTGFIDAFGEGESKVLEFSNTLARLPLLPLIALIKALTGALNLLSESIDGSSQTLDEFNESTNKQIDSIRGAEKTIDDLTKAEKLNEDQKRDLEKANKMLTQSARALEVALVNENGQLKTQAQLLEDVKNKQQEILEQKFTQALIEQAEQQQRLTRAQQGSTSLADSIAFGAVRGNFTPAQIRAAVIKDAQSSISALDAQLDASISALDRLKNGADETAKTSAKLAGSQRKAGKAFDESAARQAQAGFLGDTFEEQRIGIARETEARLRDQEKLFELEVRAVKASRDNALDKQDEIAKIRKDNAEKIQKIREQEEIKINKARLAAIQGVTGQVAQGAGGFASLAQGDLFGGTSQLAGLASPAAAGIISNVGSIVKSIGTVFGESEEQRQAQLEKQLRLQEIQNELTQQLINIEKERLDLIDKETDRQLKLNEILFSDQEERLTANLEVIGSAIEAKLIQASDLARSAGVGEITGAETAQEIAQRIRESDILQINNALAQAQINAALGRFAENPTQVASGRNAIESISSIQRPVSSSIEAAANSAISAINRVIGESGALGGAARQTQFFREQGAFDAIRSQVEASVRNTQALGEELNEVLNLVGQQVGLERQTGGGTGTGLRLQESRRTSFIDIASRGVNLIGGGFQQARISPSQLQAPGAISTALNIESKSQSIQEQQLETLKSIDEGIRASNTLLLGLRDSTDQNPETNFQQTDAFIQVQQDIISRSVNA